MWIITLVLWWYNHCRLVSKFSVCCVIFSTCTQVIYIYNIYIYILPLKLEYKWMIPTCTFCLQISVPQTGFTHLVLFMGYPCVLKRDQIDTSGRCLTRWRSPVTTVTVIFNCDAIKLVHIISISTEYICVCCGHAILSIDANCLIACICAWFV